MNVVVEGLLVNYSDEGSGPVILFIHGWGDSLSTFNTVTKELTASYRVITIDLPGFGKSQAPKNPWGLSDFAVLINKFLTKINVNLYAIIGHSNGGAITIRGVSHKIFSAEKIILLASSGVRGEFKNSKKFLRVAAKGARALTAPLPLSIKSKIKKRAYQSIGSELFVAEHMQDTFKKIISEDVVEESSLIKLPTLLIYGQNDEATPPRYGEQFHIKIKNSKLEIITNCGHFVHQQAPRIVNKIIVDFLSQ
ncbi:MAG: alpha/beta hydrolase [Patescibacteria group bacterium]